MHSFDILLQLLFHIFSNKLFRAQMKNMWIGFPCLTFLATCKLWGNNNIHSYYDLFPLIRCCLITNVEDSCWNFMGLFETLMIIFVLSLWFYLFYFSSFISSPSCRQSPKVTQALIKMSEFVVNLPGRMKEKRACELCWMKNNCIR